MKLIPTNSGMHWGKTYKPYLAPCNTPTIGASLSPFHISRCPTERSQAATERVAHIKGHKIKSNQMKCAYVSRFMRCAENRMGWGGLGVVVRERGEGEGEGDNSTELSNNRKD